MTVKWNGEQFIARVEAAVKGSLVRGAESVRSEALRLILETDKTGRIYIRRGVEHQASAPGEAPASDTGTLVSRLQTHYDRLDKFVASVGAHTEYAAALEFGTHKMVPRPYMRPALANKSEEIRRDLIRSVKGATTK